MGVFVAVVGSFGWLVIPLLAFLLAGVGAIDAGDRGTRIVGRVMFAGALVVVGATVGGEAWLGPGPSRVFAYSLAGIVALGWLIVMFQLVYSGFRVMTTGLALPLLTYAMLHDNGQTGVGEAVVGLVLISGGYVLIGLGLSIIPDPEPSSRP